MKVVACTDVHGSALSLNKIKKLIKDAKPDLVLCAGDFTRFEEGIERVLDEMNSWGVPVALIHGNHEDELIVEELVDDRENLYFVHLGYLEFGEYIISGFGGGGFSQEYPDLEFFKEHPEFLKLIDGKKLVFLNHAPPYGTVLDSLPGGGHCGSKSLVEFINRHKPLVVIVGHIHPHFGKEELVSGVRVINPGPDGMLLEL